MLRLIFMRHTERAFIPLDWQANFAIKLQNVDTLIKVLADRCSASHVRHLGLKGSLIVNIDGEFDELEDTTGSELSDANEYFWRTGISEVLGDEQPWLGGEFFPDDVVEVSPEEDGAWAPVVHLVKTLPHLTKLIYDCRNQFPPSLLVALHEHQPQCKLYHLTFRLRSLRSDTLDQHEMAIATSLSLHTIKCIHAWRDSNGEDDYHENAMPELVASLAPNLKELHMIELFPRYSCYRRRDIPREPWRGLPGFIPGRQKGDDWDDFDREFIHANAYRTDRVLRKGHLRETFRNCAVDETLAQSIWKTICQHKAGKQLKSLKLYTSGGGVFDCDEGIPNDEDINGGTASA
ncbi:hypothetical protein M7I_7465 [Glarea lozoyensis 74030]|uniref:Uncharacterized protein n=1 Tax=Glarea lozoyensis (strain ATCC 74030 / MF5533) TaxID=1104152 RepID=H0EXD1_GLAL7|nr:hypothetical protein M7I_7465 [Glarea lozoyensis 74030]